jgi:hypothetical protein
VLKLPAPNVVHGNAANWVASADLGGTPGQAPAGMTFGQWRKGYSETMSATGDDDGDGIRNDLEYALGLNPQVRNPVTALPIAQIVTNAGGRFLAITFRHRPAADLTTVVEKSEDLVTWTSQPDVTLESSTDHGDGTFTQTWRSVLPVPAAGGTRQFLRIRTTLINAP